MKANITQEFFWDMVDEFAQFYASIKAPAFLCDTDINEEIICVLPLISCSKDAENHSFVINYADLSNKRARWYANTNIRYDDKGGSDVEIAVTVSANAFKSLKIPYPPRMRFKEMEGLLCGNIEGWFPTYYDVVDDFRTQYLWQPSIKCTDIHYFYQFKLHDYDKVTEITELELR